MAAKKQQPPSPKFIGPKFEWAEKAGSYVLRLALPGLNKADFRVQVDGAGRLTVRGTKPATGAAASALHKVFQLPPAADLDGIAGRFEAGVLTLTVPKRATGAGAGAAAPTSIEEITRKMPGVAKESKPKEEEIAREDELKKPMEEATKKAQQKRQQEEEEAKSRKQEQHRPAPSPAVEKGEELKPEKPQAAAAAAATPPSEKPEDATDKAKSRKQEQHKPAALNKAEELKPKAPHAAPKPEAATGKAKAAAIAPEALAQRVRRRSEEEGANAATMTAAAKRAKMDGEKKATAACVGWKERVQGELKVLTEMKWADGMVEAARKNKEVVAIGIAAISLGFLVSHKLFRK